MWQLDFSEFETTPGGTWQRAGRRDYWPKYEHRFHISPTANRHDAIDANEFARSFWFESFIEPHLRAGACPRPVMLAKHVEDYRIDDNQIGQLF